MKTVLVVDDEPSIAQIAGDYLRHGGFCVLTASNGVDALALARAQRPDLIVLDLGLPRMDGLEVAKTLRREGNVPIIMLTARIEESDRLAGLELGADDYMTKPFSPRELVARVRSVLRRVDAAGAGGDVVRRGDLVIDNTRMQVTRGRAPIDFTPTEFQLFAAPARLASPRSAVRAADGRHLHHLLLLHGRRNDDRRVVVLRRGSPVRAAAAHLLRADLVVPRGWIVPARGGRLRRHAVAPAGAGCAAAASDGRHRPRAAQSARGAAGKTRRNAGRGLSARRGADQCGPAGNADALAPGGRPPYARAYRERHARAPEGAHRPWRADQRRGRILRRRGGGAPNQAGRARRARSAADRSRPAAHPRGAHQSHL